VRIRFLSVARRELDDAFTWYEHQSTGLGYEFLDELDRVVHRIKVYPESCAELAPGLRRALLSRFPYGLIYAQDADAIVIVAVAHLHREPRYWIGRLGDV
jgi:plasmid stabilization system protein ParE